MCVCVVVVVVVVVVVLVVVVWSGCLAEGSLSERTGSVSHRQAVLCGSEAILICNVAGNT